MEGMVNIRHATIYDLDAVAAVEDASFGADRFSRRQLAYLIADAQGSVYIAEYEDVVVGYMSVLRRSGSSVLRIYSIAVHPAARGRQIGQRLIDTAIEYAAQHSLSMISLEVRVDNEAAINLYKKNGFIVSSVIRDYYDDGSDAIRMIRKTDC